MIDIENEIITIITDKLTSKFPGISVGSYIDQNTEPVFPFVEIEESNSYTPRKRRSTKDGEEIVRLLYKFEIYSNRISGKKQECKDIANYLNDILYGMNFTRDSKNVVPNEADTRLYRLVLTYSVETDGTKLYRR